MSSNPASTSLVDDSAAPDQATEERHQEQESSQFSDSSQDAATGDSAVTGPIVEPVVVTLDEVAVDLARAAAVAEAGGVDQIGDFLVAFAEDDVAVTATFEARQPGYIGWQWSVTLAVLTAEHPTVSEVVLLPGEGSLLAPAWIPWDQRIRPGDLGVGDLLPLTADDPRVVPAYVQSDDPAVEAVAKELGIGRVRVLSREGRVDFAERLHDGDFGPSAEMAAAAPGQCLSCAFYLPLAGSLGSLIGACGNEYSPADGRVVDAGFGCGAHSETVIELPARSAPMDIVIDELVLEVHGRPEPAEPLPNVDHLPDVELGLDQVDVADVAEVAELGIDAADIGPDVVEVTDLGIDDIEVADLEEIDLDATTPGVDVVADPEG